MGGSMLSLPERVAEIQDVAREGWSWVVQNRWAVAGVILGGGILYWGVTGPRNLPPGPRGLPLIGNMLDLSENMHLDCERLREKYGNIISLNVMGTYMIILCDAELTKEAFLSRQEVFSDRQDLKVNEIIGNKDDIFTAPYGEKWKADKKFFMTTLRKHGFGTTKGEDILTKEMDNVYGLFKQGDHKDIDIRNIIERIGAIVIYTIVLGKKFSLSDSNLDDLIRKNKKFNDVLVEEGPVAYMPTSISEILFHTKLQEMRRIFSDYSNELLKLIKNRIQSFDEENLESVVDEFIKERKVDDQFPHMDFIVGNVISATNDAMHATSVSVAYTIFYLAKYPDVQNRIQEQLDAVVVQGRKVTTKDRPNLSLLNAAIHETLRLSPPFSLVGGRELKQQVDFRGFILPKGSLIMSCIYSMHMNKNTYSTPDRFNINHFLNKDGSFQNNQNLMPFGIGRRMCLGEQHARMFSFVFLGNFLLRYRIKFSDGFVAPGDMERNKAESLPAPPPFTIDINER